MLDEKDEDGCWIEDGGRGRFSWKDAGCWMEEEDEEEEEYLGMNIITQRKSKGDAGESFFLPYQKRWIEDDSHLKIMEKSRQIGISWATAYSVVRQQARPDTRLDAWVSSRDALQAKLFLEDCRAFARILNLAARERHESVVEEGRKTSSGVLQLANGKRIHSLSSNPDAQAGKRGHRVLDEFALHPDPRKLYAVSYPGITWGGGLEIISTHRGSDNFFNTLVEEAREKGNRKRVSLHRVTVVDAVEEGLLERIQAKLDPDDPRKGMGREDYLQFVRNGCADEESWRQEYLCDPADDTTAFLSCDLIASCEYSREEETEMGMVNGLASVSELANRRNPLYLGVDIGRERDLTVFWLVEVVSGMALTRRVECLEQTPFRRQEEIFNKLLELPAMRRACIDQTGLGRQFAERAVERFGGYKVEGVNFTGPVKETLAYPVRSAFESGLLRIPSDKHIRADLRAIKKETTAAGHIRFTADRGKNGHSDRFWALALALHAGRKPVRSQHFETVARPSRKRNFY